MAARWTPLKSLHCVLVAMIITLLRTPARYLGSPSEVSHEPSHRATEQIHVTRTVVGPRVVAEAVVDHPCGSGLARPHDWMQPAVGGMFAQDRDAGIGVEVRVTLIAD